MDTFEADAVVIGAGAVGLASARALALKGREVLVLEAANAIATETSSRNSEVIHAGIYYPTGSLKARLCVEGRRKLYRFLEDRGVGHLRCGKLLVATEEAEVPRLRAIHEQGRVNQVEGLAWLSAEAARALEPEVRAAAAILSPQTGVVDSHGYMLALTGEIEATGGTIALNAPFEGATPLAGGGFEVRAGGAVVTAAELVISAGL